MTDHNNIVDQETLMECLDYCPESGDWVWRRATNNRYVGKPAGRVNQSGHVIITVHGRNIYANKLCFVYQEGRWPTHRITHLDGDRQNLAWDNLKERVPKRDEVGTKKMLNCKTWGAVPHKGISYDSHSGRYYGKIMRNKKSFKTHACHTIEEAVLAREKLIVSLESTDKGVL
jgi:hypothetical protein